MYILGLRCALEFTLGSRGGKSTEHFKSIFTLLKFYSNKSESTSLKIYNTHSEWPCVFANIHKSLCQLKKATLREALRKSYMRERVGGLGDRLFIVPCAHVSKNRVKNR